MIRGKGNGQRGDRDLFFADRCFADADILSNTKEIHKRKHQQALGQQRISIFGTLTPDRRKFAKWSEEEAVKQVSEKKIRMRKGVSLKQHSLETGY